MGTVEGLAKYRLRVCYIGVLFGLFHQALLRFTTTPWTSSCTLKAYYILNITEAVQELGEWKKVPVYERVPNKSINSYIHEKNKNEASYASGSTSDNS